MREIGEGLATLEVLAGENQRAIMGIRRQVTNLRSGSVTATSTVLDSTGMLRGVVGDADQLYRTAAEQFGRGSLNTARMAFQQFVQSYPNHALAPEAHFSLADILYQQEDFDAALEAFREIQSRFPTAAKVPDALYRIALIQIEMEEIESAIDTLERITNTYPGSVIAEIAADKLEEIGS
ncbi:MAG TPA: tol-pal system protein YbgF [Gemmatimonadetes bacterium]|nr:tol-pal system protein YbgF [Gemmatimonadota bacterium]